MKHTLLLSIFLLAVPRPTLAAEPTVDEVRRAALRYAGLHGRADRWSARARWRHLLPKITADWGQLDQRDDNTQFDEWLTRDAEEMLLYDAAKNQNENNRRFRSDYSIRATVDLSGLLFDDDELGASREARARHGARLELVQRVHEAYFERLATVDALGRTAATEHARRRALEGRRQMLEAQLDGLTGGWYAAELRRSP